MTILVSDIKLLESERMTDTTDGGGRRTSREIVDGQAGNIFPKLSRMDVTKGRVNLRKIFAAVKTANLDTYGGAHLIISKPPVNEKVHILLFSSTAEDDTRSAARDRIESYVTAGPESRMVLMGRQLVGQQSIVCYQRVETKLPEVGDVFCLSAEVAGVVTAQQYFRVQTVEHSVQTFTEMIGSTLVDFERRVITIGTGAALRYEFNGVENPTQLSTVARPTKLRATSLVDAARYYGIRPLTAAAEAGDLSVRIDSIYSQIVPTATRETPIANASLDSTGALLAIASSTRTETLVESGGWATGSSRRTLRAIQPGGAVLIAGALSITDDGAGVFSDAQFAGTVDYDTGVITRTGGTSSAASWQLAYIPAVRATQVAHTRETVIGLANRGLVYVLTMHPLPAAGSFALSFRAQGRWYTLRDDGQGVVAGDDAAYGSGVIDYASGTATITLGALPDVGSSLLQSWASPTHYVIRAGGSSDVGVVEQHIALTNIPAAPGSLAIEYTSGGVDYSAVDDSNGAISGGGITGSIDYTSGDLVLRYTTRLPDALSSVRITHNTMVPTTPGQQVMRTVTVPAATTMAFGAAIEPGTLYGSVPLGDRAKSALVKDSGAGQLIVVAGQLLGQVGTLIGAKIPTDQVIGSINYSAGTITITDSVIVDGQAYWPALLNTGALTYATASPTTGAAVGAGAWSGGDVSAGLAVGTANFGARVAGVAASAESVTQTVAFTDAPLRLPLLTTVGDNVVPDSLLFVLGGATYIDRSGTLYASVSALTGVGITAGTIDYATGALALSWWPSGATPALAVQACLAAYGEASLAEINLRTAGAPLRPGSFYIQATSINGDLITGQANTAGEVSGTKVQGYIDPETGIFRIRFGELVAAAGNESAWWFDEDNVVSGQIWRPTLVVPGSIRYNAVILTSIPLNADLIGLDAVRLPSDGKVPVVRVGDLGVLHNTQTSALPNPVTLGTDYNVGREALTELWVEDATGKRLPDALIDADLDAGTVNIVIGANLSSYTQPLRAMHRISDMVLISDAQISGEVSFDPPLTRDYPQAGSYLSTALEYGDVVARVTNVRDRQVFTNWDETTGAQATAEYNIIDYPIEVLNNGAVTERWRLNFTSTTAYQVIGEGLGVIGTGATTTDCQPSNGLTGLPYFTIRSAGFGAGWAAGNQLMFETVSAAPPAWIARTAVPGASIEGDEFSLQYRGDADVE